MSDRLFAPQVSMKRTCAALTASAVGSSARGRHTSTASRDYCLPKAFEVSM
jgi:hypothetical protein